MLTSIAIVALATISALLICHSGHCFGRALRIIYESDKRNGKPYTKHLAPAALSMHGAEAVPAGGRAG